MSKKSPTILAKRSSPSTLASQRVSALQQTEKDSEAEEKKKKKEDMQASPLKPYDYRTYQRLIIVLYYEWPLHYFLNNRGPPAKGTNQNFSFKTVMSQLNLEPSVLLMTLFFCFPFYQISGLITMSHYKVTFEETRLLIRKKNTQCGQYEEARCCTECGKSVFGHALCCTLLKMKKKEREPQ